MNDLISRQAAIDAIRAMQTYKLFAGDDLILVDQAGAQTELMMLPSTQQEIIRCEDCLAHGVCRFEQALGLDGYCSKAERRQKNE